MPKVSIITPVYNAEGFITETVRSALAQTFEDFEFILVDDGSSDRTCEVVRSLSDPRIRFVEKQHGGCVESYNACLSLARGEYIAILDHDDLMNPDRIEKQVAFLDEHKDIALAGSHLDVVDARGRLIRTLRVPVGATRVMSARYVRNTVYHPTVMYRRMVVDSIGVYNEEYYPAHDTEFLLRAMGRFRADNLDAVLTKFRRRETSPTHASGSVQRQIHLALLRRTNLELLDRERDPATRRQVMLNLAKIECRYGDPRDARPWVRSAINSGGLPSSWLPVAVQSTVLRRVILLLRRLRVRDRIVRLSRTLARTLTVLRGNRTLC